MYKGMYEAKSRSVSLLKIRVGGISRPAAEKVLISVTLYRGFYVEIDNSPDMDVIWLGINTGHDSITYWYEEYPKDFPLSTINTEGLIRVDQLIAAPKLMLAW
jgi:hypothetical protein